MKLSNIVAYAAAMSLVTAPVMAQAATQPLPDRAGAQVGDAENLRGGFVIPLIALIAVILGLCVATDICGGDDEDLPTSP
jgi:hypothetical protein